MEDISAFTDKKIVPNDDLLSEAIGRTFRLWENIKKYVYSKYPDATEEWNYPGQKYGWSFRLKDKKRTIVYLLPRKKYFKTAFVFGQKATDIILKSNVSDSIKQELRSARVYAEGRGIRISVNKKDILQDIEFLIDTKLAN